MVFDAARQLLYVSVPMLDQIAVISTRTYTTVDYLPIGSRPWGGIDLSLDGRRLWVALFGKGTVAALDLQTLKRSEIDVGGVLGSLATYDVMEGRPDRVFVSANASSSGFSWIAMIKADQGGQAARVAGNRIIRATPVFARSPDPRFLYIGEGFSPNSLYKLDLTQDTAPIVLEDRHGTVEGPSTWLSALMAGGSLWTVGKCGARTPSGTPGSWRGECPRSVRTRSGSTSPRIRARSRPGR